MTRTRWIGALALLAAALASVWYVASPWYILREMKAAAAAGDSNAFASYVDFPAVRKDLKAKFRARLRAQSRKDGSGIGGLELALGSALADPVIDGLVSPGGIRAAFIARGDAAAMAGAPARNPPSAFRTGPKSIGGGFPNSSSPGRPVGNRVWSSFATAWAGSSVAWRCRPERMCRRDSGCRRFGCDCGRRPASAITGREGSAAWHWRTVSATGGCS
ncbi:MAG: hypothetical protein JWO81_1428 [Alphaproteobacteria bacterium]|nr:hypothetical protein [Alphaproteobacteria bacterium]